MSIYESEYEAETGRVALYKNALCTRAWHFFLYTYVMLYDDEASTFYGLDAIALIKYAMTAREK